MIDYDFVILWQLYIELHKVGTLQSVIALVMVASTAPLIWGTMDAAGREGRAGKYTALKFWIKIQKFLCKKVNLKILSAAILFKPWCVNQQWPKWMQIWASIQWNVLWTTPFSNWFHDIVCPYITKLQSRYICIYISLSFHDLSIQQMFMCWPPSLHYLSELSPSSSCCNQQNMV